MKTFAIVLFLVFGAIMYSKADIMEKTYLVSMRKAEFLSIVECISISKDPALCAKFAQCEKAMPYRIYAAVQKCQKEHVAQQVLRCTKHEPLYKTPVIPAKIFECVVESIHKLAPHEKEVMMKFEVCAKKLKEESCKVAVKHSIAPVHAHHPIHRLFHHLP